MVALKNDKKERGEVFVEYFINSRLKTNCFDERMNKKNYFKRKNNQK
jgi:hypothetical protein